MVGTTNNPTLNIGGNLAFTGTGFGGEIIQSGTGTWTVSGNVDFTPHGGGAGTYTATSGNTLVMNGTSKTLTTSGNALQNLTISGTVTLANATHTVNGNVNLTGSTITAGTSTLTMAGASKTIDGGGQTLNNFNANGDTTLQNTNLTVSGTLSVGTSKTLTLASGTTLTHTGATISFSSGTIAGPGTLRFTDVSGGPGTTGTLSAPVRFDATAANVPSTTVDARTYGGAVELYSNSGSSRSITFPSGTFTFSSTLTTTAAGAGVLTADLDTNDPTPTVTGATTIGASTVFSASSASTLTLNGNYTNNGTFTDNSGTISIAGSAQQTLSGTMTGSSHFNNLTITNTSGSDPDSSPSVIFAAGVNTAGTFTAATGDVKLRFTAGTTSAPTAINLAGTSGHFVTIRSSTPGTVANFNAGAGSRTVTYTAVKDSNACGSNGGSIDATDGTNRDDGDTPCWNIQAMTVSLSGNTIGLGTLTPVNVNKGSITSTVTINAASGYYSLVKYDHTLTSGANTIPDAAGGTIVAGQSKYGAATSQSGNAITQWSPASCSTGATTSNASALTTTFQTFASSSTTASNEATTLCLLASESGSEPPGSYTSTLTLVTTGKF